MTEKTQPTAHAENTAPISADLRGIDDAGTKSAPITLMTEDHACKWAWDQVREDVGTEGWTTSESCNFYGFFMWGWIYRGQYETQRPAAPPAPAAVAAPDELIRAARQALACMDGLRQHLGRGVCSIEADALRAALAAAPAQAVAQGITIDFKQAAELLEMFGGEPAEITLMTGDGHSGKGLYASYTDMPEEGAGFLGTSDDEALPAAPAQAQEDARDAARWRQVLLHVGGQRNTGCQTFGLATLKPVSGNIMQGSVLEHFVKAIDAARAAQGGA